MDEPELPTDLKSQVATAIAEDLGDGDITAQLIDAELQVNAQIIAREQGVLCGSPWANEVFHQLGLDHAPTWQLSDGEVFADQDVIASIHGPARLIMTAERTVLNFLQTLSATASQTRHLSEKIAHTGVTLLDTRKTLPGLRTAQKYAVRIGGAKNHRMGLFDAFLIKENHIASCGGIEAAIVRARSLHADKTVEIEVQSLHELQQALGAGADIVMLDNFELEAIRAAVEANSGRARLEASGGIDESQLVSIAETGVDYISIGALTKNCRAIDLSLLLT